jgi:hypothetical protein
VDASLCPFIGCSPYCEAAKAATEEGANAGDRSGAADVTLSANVPQHAARSPDGSADTGTDRRIDSSRTGTVTYVESRDFLAQYRYRLAATWNIESHGIIAHPRTGANHFAWNDLRRQNSNANPGSE